MERKRAARRIIRIPPPRARYIIGNPPEVLKEDSEETVLEADRGQP